MTRIEEIKYQLAILENRDTLHSDREAMAAYDALRAELAGITPERTSAQRAQWAIGATREATSKLIVAVRLALVKGDTSHADYCRGKIKENRAIMHELIRDLKASRATINFTGADVATEAGRQNVMAAIMGRAAENAGGAA